MARFRPILGDLSGKVGGVVFSRNASGAIVRRWVRPVRPRLLAQADNAARWSAVTRQWTDYTQSQRQAWESAAGNPFRWRPMRPVDGVSYTGSMVHDACVMQLVTGQDGARHVTAVAYNAAPVDYVPINPWTLTPPVQAGNGMLRTDQGDFPLELRSVSFNPPYSLDLVFELVGLDPFIPYTIGPGTLTDGAGGDLLHRVAHKIYLSSPSQSQTRAPHKRRRALIASVYPFPSLQFAQVTMGGTLTLSITADWQLLPLAIRPRIGWWYWLEVWQYDSEGGAAFVGTKQVRWMQGVA